VGIDDEVQLPHGVADWTVTHRPTTSRLCGEPRAEHYFPLYFHCESHRAGAVNWRIDDVVVAVGQRDEPVSTSSARVAHHSPPADTATPAASLPAFWLCVDPESENLAVFQATMSDSASLPYTLDDLHAPMLHSVEPLLRAGVRMHLVTQRERDLVVVAPGTPHCVFTPPAATKVSRNWMTPQSLLLAAVRALRGASGERGQWIADLRDKPLHCLLPALRRLYVLEPQQWGSLLAQPSSRIQMEFALGRARQLAAATADEQLDTVARQVGNCMQQ
jgi:hypothetical protein